MSGEITDGTETKITLAQIRTELEQDLTRPAPSPLPLSPAAGERDKGEGAGGEPRPTTSEQPDVHMTILQTLLELKPSTPGQRLGPIGQQPRRQLEEVVRLRAAQFAAQQIERGCSQCQAARCLAVKARTLRSWMMARPGNAPPASLGRPLTPSGAAQQQALISWLDSIGPGVGMPTLRTRFTDLARAELDSLLKDYRRAWRAANLQLIHVLAWQRPGAVWAMDFAEAPDLIDGLYPYLLAVRDLASGLQLLWQPVADLTVEAVLAELPWLFTRHGPPLLLKTDNGSAFLADLLGREFQRWGVGQLFSPPHRPEYNGSIEASIGSLKKRTEQQCERAGLPGQWTSAAVASALEQANTTARPRRLAGATPEQVWQARRPLTADERLAFQASVAQFRIEERTQRQLPIEEPLSRTEQAAVDRAAFRRALVAHDLLLFRRRRIPPRITRPKLATKG